MLVTVNVQLTTGDPFDQTTDEAAHAVLAALGGDITKDTCSITVIVPQGTAGVPWQPVPPT